MVYLSAIVAALAVVVGLSGVLYAWFRVSLDRFDSVAAKDMLSRWDAQLAELSESDREVARAHPPVEVLEAVLALPSPWSQRIQLTYSR